MNKQELNQEIKKTKVRTLQTVGRTALLLIMVEIIIWNVKKMSIPLLVTLLATCTVEVVVSLITLKELKKQ